MWDIWGVVKPRGEQVAKTETKIRTERSWKEIRIQDKGKYIENPTLWKCVEIM